MIIWGRWVCPSLGHVKIVEEIHKGQVEGDLEVFDLDPFQMFDHNRERCAANQLIFSVTNITIMHPI